MYNRYREEEKNENLENENSEIKEEESKEEVKEELSELDALKEENKRLREQYLRTLADTENYKKRVDEERARERKYASQKVVSELVDPIDMLVKVINFGSPNPEIQNYLYGFKMIADKLVNILKDEGLGEVQALNQKFDPKTMEAMSIVENDELEEDTVVEVKQTGYTYKDRLIRPAMVVVSKKTKKVENENIIEERKEEE